jgi:hypothetical protein
LGIGDLAPGDGDDLDGVGDACEDDAADGFGQLETGLADDLSGLISVEEETAGIADLDGNLLVGEADAGTAEGIDIADLLEVGGHNGGARALVERHRIDAAG